MATAGARKREQACAIPFRLRGGQPEFCLITSTRRGRWGFPKGIVDSGETSADAALKEAHEEAGLRGQIVGKSLGAYSYVKWESELRVTGWLMRVTRTALKWEEHSVRQRQWVGLDDARRMIGRPEMLDLLETAVARLESPAMAR